MIKSILHISCLLFFFTSVSYSAEPYFEDEIKLKHDLAIVWPMVQTVKIEYHLAKTQLEFLDTKAEKKAFLENFETFIKKKYFKQVMNLKLRQGKLLLLLIDKELGETPFELLKQYRTASRANFWNNFAHLTGTSLKEKYSPDHYPFLEREIELLCKTDFQL